MLQIFVIIKIQLNELFYAVLPCSVYYCILLRPITANGCHEKKKMVNFYLFPVYLRQVYIVLVLTSTNQKARNRYPEMVMAQTVCGLLHACGNLKEKGNGSFKMLRIVEKSRELYIGTKKSIILQFSFN